MYAILRCFEVSVESPFCGDFGRLLRSSFLEARISRATRACIHSNDTAYMSPVNATPRVRTILLRPSSCPCDQKSRRRILSLRHLIFPIFCARRADDDALRPLIISLQASSFRSLDSATSPPSSTAQNPPSRQIHVSCLIHTAP